MPPLDKGFRSNSPHHTRTQYLWLVLTYGMRAETAPISSVPVRWHGSEDSLEYKMLRRGNTLAWQHHLGDSVRVAKPQEVQKIYMFLYYPKFKLKMFRPVWLVSSVNFIKYSKSNKDRLNSYYFLVCKADQTCTIVIISQPLCDSSLPCAPRWCVHIDVCIL